MSDTTANDKQPFRGWLLRTVVAATFAVLGFFGRDLYEGWKYEQATAVASLDALKELSALLDESHSIFLSQNYQAKRLLQMLQKNHDKEVPENLGYDDTFLKMYDRFTPEEAELQKLIRSTTINSQRRVNQAMSKWLQGAQVFKQSNQPAPQRARLAEQLRALELHLNQWHDKYEAWIPGDVNLNRSLVYLADEKEHGIGFPQELKKTVDEVIASWR